MDGQLRIYGDIKTSRTGKERLAKKAGCSRRNTTFVFTNNRRQKKGELKWEQKLTWKTGKMILNGE